jgi:outer membrane protein insertion porin family
VTEVFRTVLKNCVAVGVVALLIMLCAPFTSAAAEAVKVTFIEVQGNKRIETATILAKIKTREGETFSPAQIKEDIRALYQLGHFEDVQVKTEGFENGIKVIFSVKEKPLIREITFEGNNEKDSDDLKKDLTILTRTAFNMQLIQENAEKIRLKYQDMGYYNTVVVPVVTELRTGDRNVLFYLEEGEKVQLKDIIITGNKAISSKEIKKAMKTEEHWFFSFFGRSGTLRTEELKEDLETIRNLYYNKGYIQVQVDEPVIENKTYTKRTCLIFGKPKTYTEKNEFVVRIHIKEGDQFRLGATTLKGNVILSDSEVMKEIQLKPGDIFSRQLLREDINRIMDRYDGIARPFASVVPQFNIDPDRKTVTLTIDIQEGGEVRIGWINISGNTKTRDKVIRREMRLDEGDLYSKKALKRSYERINNLNFFENVDIVPNRRNQEAIMDLDIKVKEKLTGTMSIGGGYSSVDRLIGIFEITQGNLGGRGQLIKFKAQIGGTRRMYVVSFMEPYLFDKPVWGKVDLYNQMQEYDGYTLKSNGFSLGVGKSFTEYVSGALKYSLDKSDVILSGTSQPPQLLLDQIKTYGNNISTSAVTASLSRDSRDYYLDPKTGSRNTVYVEYAGGPLGGDPNFIKSVADSGWYFPLFWDTVFMVRGRIGSAGALGDKPMPVGERFFVGGPSTVRGFKYGYAGPTQETSVPDPKVPGKYILTGDFSAVGGNKELIFNAEYTFPLVSAARLKGVIFYDVGRAFNDDERILFRDLRRSVGWGFRWFTPIGPLRFEWGYVIQEKPEDKTSKFEFSIGTLF